MAMALVLLALGIDAASPIAMALSEPVAAALPSPRTTVPSPPAATASPIATLRGSLAAAVRPIANGTRAWAALSLVASGGRLAPRSGWVCQQPVTSQAQLLPDSLLVK